MAEQPSSSTSSIPRATANFGSLARKMAQTRALARRSDASLRRAAISSASAKSCLASCFHRLPRPAGRELHVGGATLAGLLQIVDEGGEAAHITDRFLRSRCHQVTTPQAWAQPFIDVGDD